MAEAQAVPSMTGGTAVVGGLRDNGVEVLFGLPGIQLDGLFCALHDAGAGLRGHP